MSTNDITGKRFGRLTAIEFTGKRTKPSGNAIWLFQCDCGNLTERPIPPSKIKNPSCGCYVRDRASTLNKTHGGRHDRLYLVWMDMRRRCFDKKDKGYKHYGGRGITVCNEWKDYEVFRKWAYSNGYDETAQSHKCTIDRIDVNGNYEPQNCRWVDNKAQCNNRRNNRMIEYRGRVQTLRQWSDELGFSYSLVSKRLYAGWNVEKAFTQPSEALQWRSIHGKPNFLLNISPSEKRA